MFQASSFLVCSPSPLQSHIKSQSVKENFAFFKLLSYEVIWMLQSNDKDDIFISSTCATCKIKFWYSSLMLTHIFFFSQKVPIFYNFCAPLYGLTANKGKPCRLINDLYLEWYGAKWIWWRLSSGSREPVQSEFTTPLSDSEQTEDVINSLSIFSSIDCFSISIKKKPPPQIWSC